MVTLDSYSLVLDLEKHDESPQCTEGPDCVLLVEANECDREVQDQKISSQIRE